MKYIHINADYCVNCRLCQVWCAVEHSDSRRIISAFKEETASPRLVVEEKGLPVPCRHCKDAACIESCITGAMHRESDGRVLCDSERCIGCWTCVASCPYGALLPRQDLNIVTIEKCDLCGGSNNYPACVSHCPNGALTLREEGVSR